MHHDAYSYLIKFKAYGIPTPIADPFSHVPFHSQAYLLDRHILKWDSPAFSVTDFVL